MFDGFEDDLPLTPTESVPSSPRDFNPFPTPEELAQIFKEDAESEREWERAAMEYSPEPYFSPVRSLPTWDRLYTLADAFRERKPIEYIIEGLFPLPSLSIVYGSPGDFKSMLLMDAAVSVITGDPWLPPLREDGPAPRAIRRAPVFWYDFDNGKRKCDERFQALAKSRGLSPSTDLPFYYLSIPEPALDANNSDSVTQLLKATVIKHQIKFICIDNLSTILGDADENSVEMSRVMSNLRTLVEETRTACVVIHHQRKSKDTGANHSGESLRGHSSINAAVDLALQVQRHPGTRRVTIRSTKTRGVEVEPFGAEFTYTPRPDQELETARFLGFQVEGRRGGNGTALAETLLGILADKGQMNQSQIVEEARNKGIKSKERVRSMLIQLVGEGRLAVEEGKVKNAKLYSLP